jgi:alpha-L-rhamnosidase
MGEAYDATNEMPGWDAPGYDDTGWRAPITGEEAPSIPAEFTDPMGTRPVDLGFKAPPVLQAYPSVPIRTTQTLDPVAMTEPSPGIFIFDLGQNISGVAAIRVKGTRGTRITMRFGEGLHQDGTLMTENLRKARATDYYILRGDGKTETWSPEFTYHGFRYVEVSGLPQKPLLSDVTGIVMHSDTPLVSQFSCSDPMVNQLFKNVVWTQRANFFEVPTDCPQRDERLGWTGDAQIYVGTATRNADVAAFFKKWLSDLAEAQLDDGAYPDYAPHPYFHGSGKTGATAWMDAGIICPYTIYQAYGDQELLRQMYPSMTRFMKYRHERSPDFLGIEAGNTWGDWLALGETTPIPFIDTAYFAMTSQMMAEMAEALGKTADAEMYREWTGKIRKAFCEKYLLPSGHLSVETQTAQALALQAGVLPENARQTIANDLASMIEARGYKMATGFLGTRPLLPVLSENGRHDIACRLLQSREFPSWGYEIINGATTIWERWNSYTVEDGYGNAAMNSFSHYAFGAVCEWMFRYLAGISTVTPAYDHFRIEPLIPSDHYPRPDDVPALDWVKASFDSPMGIIASQWKIEGDQILFTATVPPNSTADLVLPSASEEITESGQALKVGNGIHSIASESGSTIVRVGSGTYFLKIPRE